VIRLIVQNLFGGLVNELLAVFGIRGWHVFLGSRPSYSFSLPRGTG
jgi:hypothetical protein